MASTLAVAMGDSILVSRSLVGNTADPENSQTAPPSTDEPDSLDLASLQEPLEKDSHDHQDHDQEGVEYIVELQDTLDSLPSDDPARPTQLFLLGCAIADHHVKAAVSGLGDMPRAIALLEEAIMATSEDNNVRRSYCNALQNICWSAYQVTRDPSRLDESIKYGRLAVGPKFPSDMEDQHTFLSQRYALALARSLKVRFEMAPPDEQTQQRIEDLNEGLRLLSPSLPGENYHYHDSRMYELCSTFALKAEATRDIKFLDHAIGLRRSHSIDVHRGGWSNLQGLIAVLGRRCEWTFEPTDLDNLVAMSRLAFQPEVGQHPDYTVPLSYIATIASLPYQREGKKLFDLDTAICLHTIALLEIERDNLENLQRRRQLLEEVGRLLDDRWKLKGEENDGYAADEADVERGQIESIIPLLGDGTKPMVECGPFGVSTTYTSRVTGESRGVSGFRMIFRRSLEEGEEREESDVWSSSVPEQSSDSEADSVHSGDERTDTAPEDTAESPKDPPQEEESAHADEVHDAELREGERPKDDMVTRRMNAL